MHIPDGFLEPEVLIPLGVVSAVGIGIALKKIGGRGASVSRTPIVGLAAAFVFAAQMVNFPIASAVSGHFLGTVFLALLFGPWMTLLIMSSVLILQSLLFQDGGVTALGANIFNLAIVANFVGWGIYRLFAGKGGNGFGRREALGAFFAAWLSTVVASLVLALELHPSKVASLGKLLAVFGGTHVVIGLAEALITVAVLKALHQAGFRRNRLDQTLLYE